MDLMVDCWCFACGGMADKGKTMDEALPKLFHCRTYSFVFNVTPCTVISLVLMLNQLTRAATRGREKQWKKKMVKFNLTKYSITPDS